MKKFIFPILIATSLLSADDVVPTLTVNGRAVLQRPANIATLSVGVTTSADTAESALTDNSQKMQSIVSSLLDTHLTKEEMQTGQFNITPLYTPYPKNPAPDFKQTIIGYEVTNMLSIRTDKIKEIGNFIDIATKSGANKIENVQFSLNDERSAWDEVIELATKNAISDATTMSSAANVKLLRVTSISLDDSRITPPRPLNATLFKSAALADTIIEPGQTEISANVHLTYEIDN